jgi:nucleoid-associated protein YgaU
MQKISGLNKTRAIACAIMLGLISSCASQQTDELPAEATSEAALLDDSESATPVADESAIFADLNGQPADSENKSTEASSDLTMTEVPASNSDSPFYNPVGGESLGRVAYTLYGDRKQASTLLGKNPELSGVKNLSAEQRVYFDFAQVRPMPTFLTKDLIDRYPGELASKIEETSGLSKQSVTLGRGETLQQLSMRLYGTTRYWTEIYLLNRDAIGNYDRVPAGVALSVYERAPVAVGNQAPQVQAPAMTESAPPRMEAQAQPAPAPEVAAQPADPIPETPDFSVAQPSEVTHVPPPAMVENPAAVVDEAPRASFIDFNNSANVRRAVYIALIVLIGCVAFYMTRSPKKKNFDMLDVTTSDTSGRAKLKDSDNHHQGIG